MNKDIRMILNPYFLEKMRAFLFLFLVLGFYFLKAQNITETRWYFGNSPENLVFDRNGRDVYLETTQATPFGTAGAVTITDQFTGNLLFYSDGTQVFDGSHTLVPGGTGLIGINQKGRMGINYRSQWPNLEANFETFSAYVDYHFEDYYSSVGLLFTSDKEGIAGLRSTTVGLQYAYQLTLNHKWTFRPGIQGAYYIRDLDFSKLTFGDQFDNTGQINPSTSEIFNTGFSAKFMDLSVGGIFYSPSLWFGAAMHHVLEPNQSITGDEVPLQRRVSFHGGYRIPFGPKINTSTSKGYSVTPSFNYRAQGDFDQLDVGAYVTLPPMIVGVWYRGLPIKNLDGIANSEALIFMLGIESKRATFGYSYDYTISDLGIGTGGAHEISITYSFNLGDPLKPDADVRQLKCPIPFIF